MNFALNYMKLGYVIVCYSKLHDIYISVSTEIASGILQLELNYD